MNLLYIIVSCALVLFIWWVQLVRYPSFRSVEENEWDSYHKAHRKNITYIAMPLMLLDLSLALWMTYIMWSIPYLICLLLVLAIWLNTFLIAVPLHTILGQKRDPKIINSLIRVNWWRTAMWSLKGLILLYCWVFR